VAMGMSGGLFVAPEVLRALRPEQQVDFDPITNARTVVQSVTGSTVTVAILNSAENTWLVYDIASGWLLETYQEKASGPAMTYVRLRLSSVN
ncbi:MAG TPA: hypothetical protein VFN03_09965, partial [Trueperaceae bacterium]|nr:hypothetical protein [Trueperaceae bacterium]